MEGEGVRRVTTLNFWSRFLKNDMYVDGKTTPITYPDYEQVKLKFRGYEKIVSKGIDKAKKYYFDSVFVAYKSDIKKTWQVISKTLSRNEKSHEMKDMS